MTVEEAKEQISRPFGILRKIIRKQNELADEQANMGVGGDTCSERVQGTLENEFSAEKIMRLEEEIVQLEYDLKESRKNASSKINRCGLNGIEKDILINRYIFFAKWNSMAKSMGYSESRLYQIHDEALKHYSRL